jgi:hypothetical protein
VNAGEDELEYPHGESIAHLNLLWHSGLLSRFVDDDQVFRFIAA